MALLKTKCELPVASLADTAPGLGVDECLSQEQGDELRSQLAVIWNYLKNTMKPIMPWHSSRTISK